MKSTNIYQKYRNYSKKDGKMRFWKVKKTDQGYIILPSKPIYCPICGERLLLHDFRVYHQPVYGFYHCDVHVKCMNCSLWLIFGVPISREEFEKLKNSALHGKVLKKPLDEFLTEEEKRKIEERVKKWGYW